MRKIKRAAALIQAIITTATILFNVMPASAFGAEEALQTITAELFTDESYSESLLSDTVITLTGETPEEASVKGYPVSYDIEGMETIAAYDITIFEKDGETVFQPADDQTVNVAFSIPQLEETNTESLSVFHIDGEGNQTEIADISTENEIVSFEAESFSVYVISKHEDPEEPLRPRVEFHFLSDKFESTGINEYSSGDYKFSNTEMDEQSSQILLNGETLQFMEDPQNHILTDDSGAVTKSYFYGWYVVAEKNTDPDLDTVTYEWSDDPQRINFDVPVSLDYDTDNQKITCTLGEYTEELDADADGCAHVYVAPIYADYYFINLLNNEEANVTDIKLSLLTSKLMAFGADLISESRIGNIKAPSPDIKHKVFIGWKRKENDGWINYITLDQNGNEKDITVKVTVDEHGNVTETEESNPDGKQGFYLQSYQGQVDSDNQINLYPIFAEVRWITFENKKGATYIGEKYILTNDEGAGTFVSSLPVPSKVGYDFEGWFTADEGVSDAVQITDGNGTIIGNYSNDELNYRITEINGQRVLTANRYDMPYDPDNPNKDQIHLYPHWLVRNDTNITVNIWKQKASDEADLPDDQKTYDYDSSHTAQTNTGATLAELLNDKLREDTNKTYAGFHYNSNNADMVKVQKKPGKDHEYETVPTETVTSDGQTIVNIYYDRNVHELQFKDSDYYKVTTDSSDISPTQYRLNGNRYTQIYFRNGAWRTSNSDYGTVYNGTRYIKTNVVKTIRAIFEHDISDNFPITGDNGKTYTTGDRWNPQNSSTYNKVLIWINEMPDESVTFTLQTANYSIKTMNYYIECLPGENGTRTYNGRKFKLYMDPQKARYNFFTEAEDYPEIRGFTKFAADPQFQSNGRIYADSADFYYTRKTSQLIYDPNYPITDPNLAFDGRLYEDDHSAAKVDDTQNKETLYFEQSFSGYDKNYQQYAPDNYTFAGWFIDQACSDQFDFDTETMPSDGLRIYAKWEPVKFRIKIDPNGAEIDHIDHSVEDYRYIIFGNNIPAEFEDTPIPPFGQSGKPYKDYSTYFNGDYQEKIVEYTLDDPKYIAISDEFADTLQDNEVYYYMNNQFIEDIDGTGLPKELRNALYLTEEELSNYYYNFYLPVIRAYKAANRAEYGTVQEVGFGVWKQNYVSKEKYTNLSNVTTNKFALEGWFEVNEDGTLAEMPYDFETAITRPYSLRAVWKLEGGYTIIYTPKFITDDNIEINGDMSVWKDPDEKTNRNYADKAETTILRQPDNITADGTATTDYIFRGWRIVGNSGTADDPEYYPLEPGVYYQPGEKFDIQSKYADSDNYIHMQAVYEKKESSIRRPDVAKLILDANKGELVGGDSLNWIQWHGSDSIGTISPKLKNDEPTTLYDQLRFHSFQSNAAVRLFKYATGDFYTNSSGEQGANYFSHGEGYMLLGFDDMPDEGDYIATYAADGIISVPRTEDKTIYAVWEPTVYANFTNDTNSDITFSLTANDTNTLYVVNQATSLYDRVKLDDLSNITIPAGETLPLRLAIPYGKGKDITVSGVNNLGRGKLLVTSSYVPGIGTPHKTPLRTDHGQEFEYTEQLVEDTHGIDIVFEEVKSDYILLLKDNKRNTGEHEFDFTESDLNNTFTLSETRSSIGYIFKGWANDPNVTEPDYPVNNQGSPIPLNDFFTDPQYVSTDPSTLAKVRELYAVWEIHNQAGIFHIYKDGPLPGNPDKEYEFNIDLNANYTYSNSDIKHPMEDSYPITLKTGEHIVIESDINYGDITTTGYIHLKIQKYDANGNPIGNQIIIGKSAVQTGHFEISDYLVTVTEDEYSNFDTTLNILASTITEGYAINEVEADRKLY